MDYLSLIILNNLYSTQFVRKFLCMELRMLAKINDNFITVTPFLTNAQCPLLLLSLSINENLPPSSFLTTNAYKSHVKCDIVTIQRRQR